MTDTASSHDLPDGPIPMGLDPGPGSLEWYEETLLIARGLRATAMQTRDPDHIAAAAHYEKNAKGLAANLVFKRLAA